MRAFQKTDLEKSILIYGRREGREKEKPWATFQKSNESAKKSTAKYVTLRHDIIFPPHNCFVFAFKKVIQL